MLIDEKGDQILIRRNHHYKLNIKEPFLLDRKTSPLH